MFHGRVPPELDGEILTSLLECASKAESETTAENEKTVSKELEQRLETEINRIMVEEEQSSEQQTIDGDETEEESGVHENLFSSGRTNVWYKQAVEALRKIKPEHYSPELATLFAELGELAKKDGEDPTYFLGTAKRMMRILKANTHYNPPTDLTSKLDQYQDVRINNETG